MRHLIDPLIDCVFKALFGDPANTDLLISLINDLTRRDPPVVWVEILNPYAPEDFLGDDHRVLDVLAQDEAGARFQVEVQLEVRSWLPQRVLYTWADLYQSQLQRGEHFRALRPVVSLWILRDRMLCDSPDWYHNFQAWDRGRGVRLTDHLDVHMVELSKWRPGAEALAAEAPWLYFLKGARQWTELPASLHTPLLEKAMAVLNRFSEKEADYHRYQSRMNHLREQAAAEDELRCEREARLEAERVLEQARLEAERLRQKLIAAGLDPDA